VKCGYILGKRVKFEKYYRVEAIAQLWLHYSRRRDFVIPLNTRLSRLICNNSNRRRVQLTRQAKRVFEAGHEAIKYLHPLLTLIQYKSKITCNGKSKEQFRFT